MIHQYKNNGYNIVLDVNSGSIHVVDDIVYEIIPLVEPLVTEGIKDGDVIKAAVLNLVHGHYPEEEILEAVAVTWVAVASGWPSATISMATKDAMDSQNLRLVSLRTQSIFFIRVPRFLPFNAWPGKIKNTARKSCFSPE